MLAYHDIYSSLEKKFNQVLIKVITNGKTC